ncbi:MAG: hypothetical protein JWP44_937 [Mucilaginibacter sp.]|nr:hypothetical protein [Mucilaginibacter sp.]
MFLYILLIINILIKNTINFYNTLNAFSLYNGDFYHTLTVFSLKNGFFYHTLKAI